MANNLNSLPILQQFIDDKGLVDYTKLNSNSSIFETLEGMRDQDISAYNTEEALAFWLNAYNLLTLFSVVERLAENPNWNGNSSLWSKFRFFILKRHRIAGKKMSLYTLENKILRKQFQDPRIHFAINCASVSCPQLPGNLFESQNLDEYLEFLTTEFINSEEVSYYSEENVLELSLIFKWYKSDFKPSVIDFIGKYRSLNFPSTPRITYKRYNWKINSQ